MYKKGNATNCYYIGDNRRRNKQKGFKTFEGNLKKTTQAQVHSAVLIPCDFESQTNGIRLR